MNKPNKSSYSQILKSSAIVGGAQGIDIIIRAFRVKIIAILLGPSGVGLLSLFQSTIEFVGRLSRFGIGSSAVRQIAVAQSDQDFERLGRIIKTLTRMSLVTATTGWLMAIALAQPLSFMIFGNNERALTLAVLGSAIFISTFYENQTALLQGLRRIKDLAVVMILSSIFGTIISIILYTILGEKGIIIALPAAAAANFTFSWWFTSKIDTPKVDMPWRELTTEAKPMISMGLAFMWTGILSTGLVFITRSLIIRKFGIDAAGIYQAAWGISGLFAGFILQAMGKDFYPRLTEVAATNKLVNQLVNEQIEVGMLIALPGLLATLAFSPWVIQLFYSQEFFLASEMLVWFVFGVYGSIISWPMAFIQLAKGASLSYSLTQTLVKILHLSFIFVGMQLFELLGVAIAYPIINVLYILIIYCVARRLSGFKWTHTVVLLIGISMLFIIMEICILRILTGNPAIISSITLVIVSGIYCLRQIVVRIGPHHRISKVITSIPIIGRYF